MIIKSQSIDSLIVENIKFLLGMRIILKGKTNKLKYGKKPQMVLHTEVDKSQATGKINSVKLDTKHACNYDNDTGTVFNKSQYEVVLRRR